MAGGKQGPGAFSRWMQHRMNARMNRKVRRGRGTFMGMDVLILHTVGRRSGQPHETPPAWKDIATAQPRYVKEARPARGPQGQLSVQGRSFSGFRTAQMRLIRSSSTSKAITSTMAPSCSAASPGRPLTLRSRSVRPAVLEAMLTM